MTTFPKGELKVWTPDPRQDSEAANQAYDAVVTRMVSATRFRVTFVHKRADPMARPEEAERILYRYECQEAMLQVLQMSPRAAIEL